MLLIVSSDAQPVPAALLPRAAAAATQRSKVQNTGEWSHVQKSRGTGTPKRLIQLAGCLPSAAWIEDRSISSCTGQFFAEDNTT